MGKHNLANDAPFPPPSPTPPPHPPPPPPPSPPPSPPFPPPPYPPCENFVSMEWTTLSEANHYADQHTLQAYIECQCPAASVNQHSPSTPWGDPYFLFNPCDAWVIDPTCRVNYADPGYENCRASENAGRRLQEQLFDFPPPTPPAPPPPKPPPLRPPPSPPPSPSPPPQPCAHTDCFEPSRPHASMPTSHRIATNAHPMESPSSVIPATRHAVRMRSDPVSNAVTLSCVGIARHSLVIC